MSGAKRVIPVNTDSFDRFLQLDKIVAVYGEDACIYLFTDQYDASYQLEVTAPWL